MAGQASENFAKKAGKVASRGPTVFPSINALYIQTKAYGVHINKNTTKI